MMKYFFYWALWLSYCLSPVASAEVTPNDVYEQIFKIKEEVNLLKRHFGTDEIKPVETFKMVLFPYHTWQKTYEILFKINLLREKYHFPIMAIPSQEPIKALMPVHVYEQTQRILTELTLLKFHLNIQEAVPRIPNFFNKTITDNFNLLNHVSYQLDLLNGTVFTPSLVFAQAIRIYEDIEVLLEALEIKDETIPPPRQVGILPKDTFETALRLLEDIRRVQNLANIEGVDLYAFKTEMTITPSEVFTMTGIILAELQLLKAHIGLRKAFTPIANYYRDRTPADVEQVLGWSLRKMRLIHSLNPA